MPYQREKESRLTFTRWPGDIVERCSFEGVAFVGGVPV